MIDTIILRIHGVKKYRGAIKQLDRFDQKGFTTSEATVYKEDIKRLNNQGITDMGEQLQIMKMHRTGQFLIKSKVAKQQNSSNHYTFAYFVNYMHDFIEFNFSIPKYVYGSNVVMFVDHIGDKKYNFSDCAQIEYNIERAYDRLLRILRHIFRFEFV